ncbi:MAG: arginine--tRNA ligase [Rickettsiales bacterium]
MSLNNSIIDKKKYLEYKLEEYKKQKNNNTSNLVSNQNIVSNINLRQYFICDAPPPNLSGDLHIGHIFNATQPDIINRFYEMQGFNVIRPFGIDDNGIPTWKLLLQELGNEYFNSSKQELEKIEHTSGILNKYTKQYEDILQEACIYYNDDYRYKTRDDFAAKISQKSFLELYNKKELYTKNWPVNWDIGYNTAISNMEIVVNEKNSKMHQINFGIVNLDFHIKDEDKLNSIEIKIATTRPELLPACVAVLYHPDHKFAKYLNNKKIKVPLFNFYVPLIADDKVDPEKGTGFVMCCTFGDQTDVYWWNKYNLPLKQIITVKGILDLAKYYNLNTGKHIVKDLDDIELYCNELHSNYNNELNSDSYKACIDVLSKLNNLTINAARVKIIEILHENNLLIESKDIVHNVACSERSGAPIQIICVPQWYIKTIQHKEAILAINNQIKWYPAMMKKKLEEWVENINVDWCISRQRPWGIQVPVLYNAKGEIFLPEDDILPIKISKKYYLNIATNKIVAFDIEHKLIDGQINYIELFLDENVLDTWATSSLTHEILMHLLNSKTKQDDIKILDMRFQGHEIIRTWAFTTILRSYLSRKQIPWHNIVITGWCLASTGEKISKSKNNAPNTEKIIKECGIDAIRYWAVKARLGNDISFCLQTAKNGDKLINKILNASKFIQINFELLSNNKIKFENDDIDLNTLSNKLDKLFLIKFIDCVEQITTNIKNYQTAESFDLCEKFFKSDFCDYYLEIIKKRFYNSEGIDLESQLSTSYTCFIFMNIFLRLLRPFLPKLSEYLYLTLYNCNLELNNLYKLWPQEKLIISIKELGSINKQEDIDVFNNIINIMEQIRKYKTENKLSMNSEIESVQIYLKNNIDISILLDIKAASNTKSISCSTNDEFTENPITTDEIIVNIK